MHQRNRFLPDLLLHAPTLGVGQSLLCLTPKAVSLVLFYLNVYALDKLLTP
jgi:hypothetical protein